MIDTRTNAVSIRVQGNRKRVIYCELGGYSANWVAMTAMLHVARDQSISKSRTYGWHTCGYIHLYDTVQSPCVLHMEASAVKGFSMISMIHPPLVLNAHPLELGWIA